MSKDNLYYHIANAGLLIIGLLSVFKIIGAVLFFMLILPGVIVGFLVSWQLREKRPQNVDLFIGMLSLASVVITLSRLYEVEISFNNLLTIFSIALMWLGLFQSFGVRPKEGGYALVQFISMCLLVSSVALALEQEGLYLLYLAAYLFLLIFALRINLIAEKRRKGSLVIGEQEEVLGLFSQLKLSVIIFSCLILITSLLFPFVPRFENISLRWIPSDLLGLPEKVPLLKLISDASRKIKENKTVKKEQVVDERLKKRETDKGTSPIQPEGKKEENETFPFDKNSFVDRDGLAQQIESFNIKPASVEMPLNRTTQLRAEVRIKDGTVINVTKLVEWEIQDSKILEIEENGTIKPKIEGNTIVSASFQGSFSNNVFVTITPPQAPPKKRSPIFYLFLILWWVLLTIALWLYIRIMMRRNRLKNLAFQYPRIFIREVYISLCKVLKIIGIPRLSHIAPREFVESLRQEKTLNIGALPQMTERFLEAIFSTHDITKKDSCDTFKIFDETTEVFLEKTGFFRKIAGRVLKLEVPAIERI